MRVEIEQSRDSRLTEATTKRGFGKELEESREECVHGRTQREKIQLLIFTCINRSYLTEIS